jgi:signal transduction histidine kinase
MAIIFTPLIVALTMIVSRRAPSSALPDSTKKSRHCTTTIVHSMHDNSLQLICFPTETIKPQADNLSGQDGQASSEGFANHTGNISGEDGTMAILILLQNSGLASEIGTSLRRDGRIVKSCPSVSGPEFLKEFPETELIITDLAPPVLRLLSVGGSRLLSGTAPILVLASPGHCANFARMLRSGQDRCVPFDPWPDAVESVRQTVKEMTAVTNQRSEIKGQMSEVRDEPGDRILRAAAAERRTKRIAADQAHEYRADRFARKVMNRQVRFVSDVAHDLRTPLTAIGEFAELMQSGLSGDMTDQQRRYVGIIERCCGEAARMVYDMLDGARLQSGNIHPHRQAIDLRAVFDDMVESLEPAIRQSEILLSVEAPDSLPRVFADRDMLGRIIGNLVSNALKFSPRNSTVTLRSERFSVSLARVSVIDMGSGITSADLRRIFRRFEQGSNPGQRGVGLGLAIVRELVKLHGGRVTVESSPGRGSRFHFTVPLFLPTAIMRRQLAAQSVKKNGTATAWTFTFQDSAKYDAVHRLITASVRPRDLVLPEDLRRHLLLVTHSKQPDRLIERLRQQIASYSGLVPAVTRLNESELPSWLGVGARSVPPAIPTQPTQLAG